MILCKKERSPSLLEIKLKYKDFPGSSVVKTPRVKCRGHEFDPPFRELRSHVPHGKAKKKTTDKIICGVCYEDIVGDLNITMLFYIK